MKRRKFLTRLSAGVSGLFLPWQGAQAGNAVLRGYLRTNWSRDPYSLGSYSFVAKGARLGDRAAVREPIDNTVFFAGEAVHPSYTSTVHAAYESGLSVARDVGRNTSGKVAIIGAGISGLAAAHALAEKSRHVTVLEARNRIGGRIWTSDALGTPLDLGASWIHGTRRNPLTALARRAHATTVITDDTYVTRGAGGRKIADIDVPDWVENVTMVQHDGAADSREIDFKAYMSMPQYGGEDVIFNRGYVSILAALRGNYQVRTSQKVTMIEHSENGVTIMSNGIANNFDVVIVTLPLGVLKNKSVEFNPPFPKDKQKAIARMGMGTLDKLYLLYDRPFWDQDTTWIVTPENGLRRGYFNQWLNLYKYIEQPVIMGFNGGPPAIELAGLSDMEMVNMAQQTLARAYP